MFWDSMLHVGDIYYVGNIFFGIILDCIVICAGCNFWKSPFYYHYNARFSSGTNKNLTFLRLFLANLVGCFCKNRSTGSQQRRVRKRIEGDLVALGAKIMDRTIIDERNVIRADWKIIWTSNFNKCVWTVCNKILNVELKETNILLTKWKLN
jgi:hypothetical protein